MRVSRVVGLLGSVLLCLGVILSPRLPTADWPAHWAALQPLRKSPIGWPLVWFLVFAGVILLTFAWLWLGARVRGRADGTAAVRWTVAIWCVPLLLGPPLFSKDVWSYVADGYLTGQGRSPYVVTPSVLHGPMLEAVSLKWRHTPAPYGPVTLLWGGLWSRFTSDPWTLMLLQRGLAVVGLVLLAYAVPRLAARAGGDPATASWLAIGSPFLLVNGVADAHNDLIMVGLMAMALVAAAGRGWLLGAVLAGAAAAVKVPGAAVCLGVVLVSLPVGASLGARLYRAVCVGGVAAAVVACLGAVGKLGLGWVGALGVAVVRISPLSFTTDAGRFAHMVFHDATLPWVHLARAVGILALVAVSGLALVRGPTGGGRDSLRAAAFVALAFTLLGPVVRPWYFLWCLPLLACCALASRGRDVLLLVLLALGLLAPLSPSTRIPGGSIVIAIGVVLALVAGLVLPVRLLPQGHDALTSGAGPHVR